MSHPATFEDLRHSTESRPIYAYHKIDDSFVTGGGNAQVFALQARFQLTDELSFIATKDGIVARIGDFYPLIELSRIHVYTNGDRLPIADEGEDFSNFGASAAAGKGLITMGAGARYRVSKDVDLGAIYQVPLDRGPGSQILDWRVTTDLIVRF